MATMTKNFNAQTITPVSGNHPRQLYEHQVEACQALDKINQKSVFHTLLVLPTGGGKTLTAVHWLLKNAVDKKKKILWLAHRHLLLEQAADTFAHNAYTDIMLNHTTFNYRMISGIHDKPVHIKESDSILIAGKDSIIRSLHYLDKWLANEDIFLVIDEAHHAVAKSYRKIIQYAEEHAKSVKLLGLTATPFRTAEEEKGALKQIFTDDIVYKTDLTALIEKKILSMPYFEECETKVSFSEQLGLQAIKSIEHLDILPEDIAKKIGGHSERNHLIVKKYLENYQKYGQTIVFAIDRDHAVALNKLFNEKGKKYGIKSDFIISGVQDTFTGITVSSKDNEEKIDRYRRGEIQVLINVNILTEGTDLPQTHTVFLTRPTVSTVLMTQMVGRALRGELAGGTKEAYIISFVDDWNSKIAWVNPQSLTESEYHEKESPVSKKQKQLRLIAISKIEEFAMIADSAVDTSKLDSIAMIERIPLGMYLLSAFEWTYQILIYNSTESAYHSLILDLPEIMNYFHIEEETIPDDLLEKMTDYCIENYFNENMIPAYHRADIEHLLMFYAQKAIAPPFMTLDELDRKKLDVSVIARKIYDENMRRKEQNAYIDSLWNEENSIIRIFYSNQYFFKRMIEIELDKLDGYLEISYSVPQTEAEQRRIEELPLQKMIELYPDTGIALKEKIYQKSRNADGNYVCANCQQVYKTREFLQIDHITPISKGGLTVEDNLQVLCRTCNLKKSDKS